MKTTFLKSLVCACAALGAAACSDIDDLRRDVDNLEHRVTALETQIQQLNDNVVALQTLMSGATVNSVTEADGVYTVTLSNGDTLTLTQGSEGGYIEPKIAIDDEGYWIISVNNDGQFERMKDKDGNEVRAIAQDGAPGNNGIDGKTPQFRVDGENYWQVSYDGGSNWDYVLNENGGKVKADDTVGTTDPFFADVKVEGDKLVLTLLEGGTSYEIPIYAGFKCIISGAESVVEFDYNATKTFDVDMDGVENTIVTAPAGWTAALTAKDPAPAAGTPAYTLTVTAPAPAGTRAEADSRTDVSILAVSANGLSTIAKLLVNTTGTVLHQPSVTSITVDPTATTETSLTFSVVTDDATGWKYICQSSAETAPDAAKVMADGTAGIEGANTVNGLTKNTAYTIYVVAYYDSTLSELRTEKARTLKGVTDYWEEGVTLGGVTYDKNTTGAKHITTAEEAATVKGKGIYFIEPGLEVTFTSSQKIEELVLIGNQSNQPVKVTLGANAYFSLSNGTGLILKNIELDASARQNYVLNFPTTDTHACENLIFEDCKISSPASTNTNKNNHFSYFKNTNGSIKNITINNCVICINSTMEGQNTRFISLDAGTIAENGKMTVENSIFYTQKPYYTNGTLIIVTTAAQVMPTVTISVKNCSFVNFIGATQSYFRLSTVKSIDFSKNILWSNSSVTASAIFNFHADSDAQLEYQDNICFGSTKWNYAMGSSGLPASGQYTKAGSDPFATTDFDAGKFVPADKVKGYGATIE